MALCQCDCPKFKIQHKTCRRICSHVAAVACGTPVLRLRLTLFIVAEWYWEGWRRKRFGSQGANRETEIARRASAHIVEHFLLARGKVEPTETFRRKRGRHRGGLVSDGYKSDDSIEEPPSLTPDAVHMRKLLLGVVESFVALLYRVREQQIQRHRRCVAQRSRNQKLNSDNFTPSRKRSVDGKKSRSLSRDFLERTSSEGEGDVTKLDGRVSALQTKKCYNTL